MKLKVTSYQVLKHHIHISYQLNEQLLETKIIYPSVDLLDLYKSYPAEQIETIYATIAFFEGFKYCLAFPTTYDVSKIAKHLPKTATDVFQDWFPLAWSQHLYENKRFDYKGPEIISSRPFKEDDTPCSIQKDKTNKVLTCNGGGKDSYVMMRMLEDADIEYETYQFARTEYGKLRTQHDLMDLSYQQLNPSNNHRVSVYDDFTDGMLNNIYFPEIIGESALGNPCQVGTPEGIFEALLICLAHNIPFLTVGNEKSADEGNLYSDELGHQVNHQWIKSMDAETRFGAFIKKSLVSNIEYFSLLKPIHDTLIYDLFSRNPETLPFIHSCNVEKPWCKKCAKCAYVWINLVSIFDTGLVYEVFQENLLDKEELTQSFRELLGLKEQNAFECVGEIHETRLAFKKSHEKGFTGKAMDIFVNEVLPNCNEEYWDNIEKKYMTIDHENHNIPEDIYKKIYGSKFNKTAA